MDAEGPPAKVKVSGSKAPFKSPSRLLVKLAPTWLRKEFLAAVAFGKPMREKRIPVQVLIERRDNGGVCIKHTGQNKQGRKQSGNHLSLE